MYTLQLLKQCPTCKGTGKQQVYVNWLDDETYGVEVECSKYMLITCSDCNREPNEIIWKEAVTFEQLSKGINLKINFENLLTNENECGKMNLPTKKKGEK